MPVSREITELENQGFKSPGVAQVYKALRDQWHTGDRDRELSLRLMFLAWYCLAEPVWLTGIEGTEEKVRELQDTFVNVHSFFESRISDDAELLYTFGLAANLFGLYLPNPESWEKRGEEYQKRYRALMPNGIDPEVFNERGLYGEYYKHMALRSEY